MSRYRTQEEFKEKRGFRRLRPKSRDLEGPNEEEEYQEQSELGFSRSKHAVGVKKAIQMPRFRPTERPVRLPKWSQ